jgi:nucleotide-binding universal stress UspA family protein
MEKKDILCATDLSPASKTAVSYAMDLSRRASSSLKLLHVIGDEKERASALQAMRSQAEAAGSADVGQLVALGEPLEQIAQECARGHWLMVLATHGLRGLRQKLLGADILKLVRKVHIPCLVVKEQSPKDLGIGPFVLPVAAHEDVDRLIDIVIELSRIYSAEVHVYRLLRPGENPSDELLRNRAKMEERLITAGVKHQMVDEPRHSASIGFAGPTIDYAEKAGAALIAMMSHASKEYTYMADAEKERLLTNPANIPILCC